MCLRLLLSCLYSIQKARLEANEVFKNVPLGKKRKGSLCERNSSSLAGNAKKRLSRGHERQRENRKNLPSKRESSEKQLGAENGNAERINNGRQRPVRITRVQAAQEEALKSFRGCSLDKIAKERRKSASKGGRLSRRVSSSRRGSLGTRRRGSARLNASKKRTTEVQAAQLDALQSFSGENLSNRSQFRVRVTADSTDETRKHLCGTVEVENPSTVRRQNGCTVFEEPEGSSGVTTTGTVTYKEDSNQNGFPAQNLLSCGDISLQQQNVEALPAGKDPLAGHSVEHACRDEVTERCHSDEGSVIVQASLVRDKGVSVEVSPDQTRESHVRSMRMSPIPERAQLDNPRTPEPERSPASKQLTRLEKARLEVLKSFRGQAFDQVIKTSSRKMAKYLTPVKHQGTNTEILTTTTPSQTEDAYCTQPPRAKRSCYSNLGDKSFCDRGALLETSKMVVMTARYLNTPSPNCSPVDPYDL